MTELSIEILTTARKNEKIILQRLAELGQVNVAKAMGVDESTISRMKNGDIAKAALLLAALGQSPFQSNSMVVTPDKFFSLATFAKDGLQMFIDERDTLLRKLDVCEQEGGV